VDRSSTPALGRRGFLWSFRYAMRGIVATHHTESNMRHHTRFFAILLCFELVIRPSIGLVSVADFTACIVVALELLNTSVEHVCDLSTGRVWHESAMFAKDAAAGAVLVSGIGAMIVGVYLLVATFPWKWQMFSAVHLIGALVNLAMLGSIAWLYIRHWRLQRDLRARD